MRQTPLFFALVAKWRDVAVRLGIPRREQEKMSVCFTR